MLLYWIMFLIPTTAVLVTGRQLKVNLAPYVLTGLVFAILIGLRHEVGGDWFNYFDRFEQIAYLTYGEILQDEDPGYYLLSALMHNWGWGIYGVNFFCALIFVIGLLRLAKQQYNPWLALAVAVPYLVVVVSMGYTRQSVAIGFVMWAIAALDDKRFIRFLVLAVLAATFHKSAVLMIGVGMFGQGTGKLLRIAAVGFVGAGIYTAFLAEHQEGLVRVYVDTQMQSQGAMIRVAMNFMPAVMFFLFRKQWKQYYDDYTFWRIISLGAIAALFLVGVASTAVDRMALYMIPLQIVVFSRLPLLAGSRMAPKSITVLILSYFALVLFVWLNFAVHAKAWLPYINLLWIDL